MSGFIGLYCFNLCHTQSSIVNFSINIYNLDSVFNSMLGYRKCSRIFSFWKSFKSGLVNNSETEKLWQTLNSPKISLIQESLQSYFYQFIYRSDLLLIPIIIINLIYGKNLLKMIYEGIWEFKVDLLFSPYFWNLVYDSSAIS